MPLAVAIISAPPGCAELVLAITSRNAPAPDTVMAAENELSLDVFQFVPLSQLAGKNSCTEPLEEWLLK
jgi:hypothetical protein